MERGTGMAAEVAVLVSESVRHVSEFTGTITELPPQSLTALELSPWMPLSDAPVDRLDLKKLGSARPAIVTSSEFWRAPVSIPPFFVVITTSSETVWALLTVAILGIAVPWVSHSGRCQGTKDDQKDVSEVTEGTELN